MDDKVITGMFNIANGRSMFNDLAVSALWHVLVSAGVLPKQQALAALDAALLTVERQHATQQKNRAMIDRARLRLEELIKQIASIPR